MIYLDRPSALHRLHPQTKIVAALLAFACALTLSDPRWLLLPAACLLAVIAACRLFPAYRSVAFLMVLLFAATAAMWALVLGGGDPVLSMGPLRISRGGLWFGVGMGMRLDLMIAAGVVYLATTRVEETTWGLHRTGLPYRVAFALGLSFRLLPLFLAQVRRIREAQTARGLSEWEGGAIARVRAHLPLVAPVILSALRRSDRLAVALECRGFGASAKRTSMLQPRFGRADVLALAAVGGLLAFEVVLRLAGHGCIGAGRVPLPG